MKKLVDAEFGDAIKLLLELENEQDPIEVERRVSHFFETGSPSKLKMALGFSSRTNANTDRPCSQPHPIWGINYPLQKIARNLEQLKGIPSKTEVVVLVSSGAYNPIHMLHLRAFYVARQHIEANYKFPVVGAMFSPSHDTYVRVKNRRTPREMIPRKHRLALMEAAVQTSTWIEVDKWEITRRRVLDYLSTLHHVREMCETHFPHFKCRLVYVCGVNTVVKLSHSALHQEGFGCLTVCRPSQTEMVMKHLGNKITKSTIVVEDTGVLPMELERATSFRVRKALVEHEKVSTLEAMVGKQVYAYMLQHGIDKKIAGKEPWSEEDKAWREIDIPYVEYTEG
jgi:nicotinic acid mononucleotide adenylyltransferase